MFAENLGAFLGDFGVTVYYGTQSALAIFDQPDMLELSERAISREYRILYEASALIGLKYEDTVTIDVNNTGRLPTMDETDVTMDSTEITLDEALPAYSVLEVRSVDDGRFYEARLEAQ